MQEQDRGKDVLGHEFITIAKEEMREGRRRNGKEKQQEWQQLQEVETEGGN